MVPPILREATHSKIASSKLIDKLLFCELLIESGVVGIVAILYLQFDDWEGTDSGSPGGICMMDLVWTHQNVSTQNVYGLISTGAHFKLEATWSVCFLGAGLFANVCDFGYERIWWTILMVYSNPK